MATTIQLTVFFASSALNASGVDGIMPLDLAERYLTTMTNYFKYKAVAVDIYPDIKDANARMVLDQPHQINTAQHDLSVRQLAHARYPHGNGRLPVIFAQLNESSRFPLVKNEDRKRSFLPEILRSEPAMVPLKVCGWVPDEKLITNSWLNFVMINVNRRSVPELVLAHETGHAAGLDHDETKEGANNLMYWGDAFSARGLYDWQMQKIKDAYFTHDV